MQHKHSVPSQYVPHKDYDSKDDLTLNLVPRIRYKDLMAAPSTRTQFTLKVYDKHPGLRKPTLEVLSTSSTKNTLENIATVKFNAAPKHRRPYLIYIIEESV